MKLRLSLLAAAIALPFSVGAAAQTEAENALARAADGPVSIKRDARSGDVRFVQARQGGDLMPGAPADKSNRFLRQNAAVFGIANIDRELRLTDANVDQTGQRTEKFQQLYNNVPVFGARLVTAINRSGELKSVNGAVAPELSVDTNPRIAASDAASSAIDHVARQHAPRALGVLTAEPATLYIYGKDFVRGRTGGHELVWEIEVVGQHTREFIYVSAVHGKVVDQITGTYDVMNRQIYDGGFGGQFNVWSEGDATPTGNTAWDELIDYTEDTYNLYSSMTNGGFLSWDGNDGIMHAVNNDPAISCPNAQFTGSYIRFCDGTTTDDVVSHEWTHGYTQETHGVIYLDQSGAINEAYSDIFGEVVDFLNGAGNDTPGGTRAVGGCSIFGGSPLPEFSVLSPAEVAGSYDVQGAAFNPAGDVNVSGNLVAAVPNTGCTTIGTAVSGNIAVIDRGGCSFVDKINNAASAGAIGALVVNNTAGAPISMGGAGAPGIPSVMVSQTEGNAIKAASNVTASISLFSSSQNSYRWMVGEDSSAFGGAIRDMWNPACMGDPDKVSSPLYACDPTGADSGGVHSNSGIINHGFALLVDGGTFNGQSIAPLGLTKAAHLYWRTMNVYQTPISGYADHAAALSASCTDLIGQNLRNLSTDVDITGLSGEIITAVDCDQVEKVILAVELNQQPMLCDFQTLLAQNPPAACGAGESEVAVLDQDFESGLGGWTVGSRDIANVATFDVPQWTVAGNLPLNVAGQAAFAADPIIGDCQSDTEAGVNYLESPAFVLPANGLLTFDHSMSSEAQWDGGNVKVSVNGGAFQLVPASAFLYNPYTSALNAGDNPMAGEPAWHGRDGGAFQSTWGESQIDLSAIAAAGDDVVIRFDMGTDGCNGLIGWYVDNVKAFSCEVDVADSDTDGVADDVDNCTNEPNSDQLDIDGDGFGNACDTDVNNDCVVNFLDVSSFVGAFNTTNPTYDFNGDGAVNFIDFVQLTSSFGTQPGPSGQTSCN
ncbi:MAG: M4 family metallopeptidase [Gammaproteobacteria bacterium]